MFRKIDFDLTHAPTRRSIPIPPGTKNVNIPLLSYSIANATPTAPTICNRDLIISAKKMIDILVIDFSTSRKILITNMLQTRLVSPKISMIIDTCS